VLRVGVCVRVCEREGREPFVDLLRAHFRASFARVWKTRFERASKLEKRSRRLCASRARA
jgi:hypothetical protein